MKKLIRGISVFVFLCVGILAMLIIVPLVSEKEILIGYTSGSQLIYGTIFMIFILCIVFVILKYRQHKCGKNLAIMLFVSAISTVVLLGTSFCYLLFMANSKTYYTFYSPDRKYSVIVKEWSWLLAGSVTLYERTNPFLIEEKEIIITDDGFRPIAADAYEIQWNDNVVTFVIETTDWERGKETAVVELGISTKSY